MTDDDQVKRKTLLLDVGARISAGDVDLAGGRVTGSLGHVPVSYRLVDDGRERFTEVLAEGPRTPVALEALPDGTFEGAPAEVARALMDAHVREELRELAPTHVLVVGGSISLVRPGWIDHLGGPLRFVRLAAALADRIEPAFTAFGNAQTGGGPYRDSQPPVVPLWTRELRGLAYARRTRLGEDDPIVRYVMKLGWIKGT
jgi:hypothetical protein